MVCGVSAPRPRNCTCHCTAYVFESDDFVARTFDDFRILMDRQVFLSELRNAIIGLKWPPNGTVRFNYYIVACDVIV